MERVITVLHMQGCPGAPRAVEVATEIAEEVADVRVEVVTIADADEAEARGLRGSPTVLVDGRDVDPGSSVPVGSTG